MEPDPNPVRIDTSTDESTVAASTSTEKVSCMKTLIAECPHCGTAVRMGESGWLLPCGTRSEDTAYRSTACRIIAGLREKLAERVPADYGYAEL